MTKAKEREIRKHRRSLKREEKEARRAERLERIRRRELAKRTVEKIVRENGNRLPPAPYCPICGWAWCEHQIGKRINAKNKDDNPSMD